MRPVGPKKKKEFKPKKKNKKICGKKNLSLQAVLLKSK